MSAEPDYYIRNGNKLFLFESKDILINAGVKVTYDFNQYEKEFKKKLYFEEKNGKIEKKAVLQLINNVERILSGQFALDQGIKSKSISIYPIIVLHDRQFDVLGLNFLINDWFEIEVEKLKLKNIFVERVRPITIINIDTIILFQDALKDKKINLDTILDEYFQYIAHDKNKKFSTEQQAQEYVKRKYIPFSIFISDFLAKKKYSKQPKMLLELGVKLFEESN